VWSRAITPSGCACPLSCDTNAISSSFGDQVGIEPSRPLTRRSAPVASVSSQIVEMPP